MDMPPPSPFAHRIAPRHALIAAALCWTGFAAVAWMVHAGATTALDREGLLFWRSGAELMPAGPGWLLEGMLDLTALGGVFLRNLFALGAVAALLFIGARREALAFAVTVSGAWIADWLIKIAVARPRPQIVPHLTEVSGTSFPSGHSFNAAAIYIAMALTFAAMSAHRSVRLTLIGGTIALSLAIAASRVWLGVHFPTGAAAGWLGGAGWAFFASALLHRQTNG